MRKKIKNKYLSTRLKNIEDKLALESKPESKFIKFINCFIVYFSICLLIAIAIIPRIEIDKEVFVRYNTNYKDTYKASNIYKSYTSNVTSNGNIDTGKLGKYKIDYKLKYGPFSIKQQKEVVVIDDVKPEITLKGPEKVFVCPNATYKEEGYTAVDEYDGDLTKKVIVKDISDKIEYIVSDKSHNKTSKYRYINHKDETAPKITLIGGSEITLTKGNNYHDPGYKAFDNCDGDVTDKVKITGKVNNNETGTYELKYNVTDSSNNNIEVIRKVKVVLPSVTNQGIIYLTFDDGPSNLTLEILKILEEENVLATFFVTGHVNDEVSILKKTFEAGHAIGLHTYSHDYAYLYSHDENFINDIEKVGNSVYNITGYKSKIIRFPGGSSNTISKRYSSGIMTRLTKDVVNKGYKYFDWNVDSDDAGRAVNNADLIYKNVIEGLKSNRENVVLMHDSMVHQASVSALKNIITYGKNNGYTFKKIDDNTKMVTHGVNN